jgi:phosphate-selective porin OprO/OprP
MAAAAAFLAAALGKGASAQRPPPPSAPPAPTPTATPAPSPAPSQEPGGASAAGTEDERGNQEEEEEDAPKSEQVTNPGEVAFTDYRPFDLEEIQPEKFGSKWQGFVAGVRGLARYSLFDGAVKFRLGARAQVDGTAGDGNGMFETSYGPIESDLGLRRGVIFAVGRIKDFNFELGFDAGADWGVDSAWIEGASGGLEVWGHYLGKLRIGYVGEPFSLERQTSSFNTGLEERSLPVQTFAPGSNLGVLIHDSARSHRASWAVGLFSVGKSNDENASTSQLSLTGRATWLPAYSDKGRRLIHVGLSASTRSPTGGDVRYRSRPEARFVDFLADTGDFSADTVRLLGAELAAVNGPLWAAAEYIVSDIGAELAGDPTFRGSYVQVGWFITGESRPYRTNSGTFDRVLPNASMRGVESVTNGPTGAWELAARISRVDLNDGLIAGGELTDFSAALNWYPNATTRIGLNYVHAQPQDRGSAHIAVLRLQYNPW